MAEAVNIGPFFVQWKLLALFVSVAAGLAAMRWRLRGSKDRALVIDTLTGSLLWVLLFWKFGELLFDPLPLFRRPVEALLMAASTRGAMIGVVLAVLYVLIRFKRAGVSLLVLIDALPVGILAAVMLDSLLVWRYGKITALPWGISLHDAAYRYHPVNAYLFIASIVLLLRMLLNRAQETAGRQAREFFVLFGMCGLLISLFAVAEARLLFLSAGQWVFVAMIGFGAALPYLFGNNGK